MNEIRYLHTCGHERPSLALLQHLTLGVTACLGIHTVQLHFEQFKCKLMALLARTGAGSLHLRAPTVVLRLVKDLSNFVHFDGPECKRLTAHGCCTFDQILLTVTEKATV